MDLPFDDATARTFVPADAEPHRWSAATRIGFRLAFCYLGGYCVCNGNATISTPDPDHQTLRPTGPDAGTGSTLTLTLASPAASYPLLHRGFHWISEDPYQR